MDDLVEHFSGHDPGSLSILPVHQSQPNFAGAKPRHVDVSAPVPAATSSTTSTLLTSTNMVKLSRSTPTVVQPQYATTPFNGGRASAHSAGYGIMDLDAYRELFRREEVLPVANVYGSMENRSTNHEARSADQNDDDENEGDYIRHFQDKDSTDASALSHPRPRRNLLSDLENINSDASIKHEPVSRLVNDHPLQHEPNGYYTMTGYLDSQNEDDCSELTDHLGTEDQILEEPVERLYDNETELVEQDGVFDEASSYDEDKAHGINGTKKASTHPHVPAASQNPSEWDVFRQRLGDLHQQDMARDALLIVSTLLRDPRASHMLTELQDLHKKIQDLRQCGTQSSFDGPKLNGNDPRAEAAERSLIEARQDMVN
jgi:hypothetical protein